MPLPQFFDPRWAASIQSAFGGWANQARSLSALAPNGILSPAYLLTTLSNPASNPINLPSGATFFGVRLPDGTYSGTSINTLQPNQRLVAFQMCFCNNHIPGAANGHSYGVSYYVVTDPPFPNNTIIDLDVPVDKPDDPTWELVGDDPPTEPPTKPPPLGLIILIISSIINLSANLSRKKAVWGNMLYGSTGNMLSYFQASNPPDVYREAGVQAPTADFFYRAFNFSWWSEPEGIRDLPCFAWSPLPKYDEVTINTSFVAWVELNLNVYKGALETGLPIEFMDTLAWALLGVDVRGASGWEDYNAYLALRATWEANIRVIAESNGITIVSNNRGRLDPDTNEFDPTKHTIMSFYSAYAVSLSLSPPPVYPPNGLAITSSPLFQWLTKLYDTKYINNSVEFQDGFSFTRSMRLWNHGFLGIDFLTSNPVVKFEREGLWYHYIMADSSRLSVKGELTEAIINSCYADHPAKADLLDIVSKNPVKLIFPDYSHPFSVKTNPIPCWNTPYSPHHFRKVGLLTSGMGSAQLGLGETIDSYPYSIAKEFEAKIDVPGQLENGHILTYRTKPIVLIPNSYYSGLVNTGLDQLGIAGILNASFDAISAIAGYASAVVPPLSVISDLIAAAKLVQTIISLSNGDLTKHQQHNGFVYQRGWVGYPSKFRVCRTDPTLPTPVNNAVRVLDAPNDKSASPPIDQEVQVVKLPNSPNTRLGGFPDV